MVTSQMAIPALRLSELFAAEGPPGLVVGHEGQGYATHYEQMCAQPVENERGLSAAAARAN